MSRELVKLIRQSYKMTTKDFSELIGVSLSSYSQYESGYSNSDLVPKKIMEIIPSKVIIEAQKLLDITKDKVI